MKKLRDYLSDTPSPAQTTPTLTVDKTDPSENLYNEYKKTGKIPGQNSDFPKRNNSLYDVFKKRKQKESNLTDYPNMKKAFQNKKKIK